MPRIFLLVVGDDLWSRGGKHSLRRAGQRVRLFVHCHGTFLSRVSRFPVGRRVRTTGEQMIEDRGGWQKSGGVADRNTGQESPVNPPTRKSALRLPYSTPANRVQSRLIVPNPTPLQPSDARRSGDRPLPGRWQYYMRFCISRNRLRRLSALDDCGAFRTAEGELAAVDFNRL